ncbi:cytochrome c [Stutzerimonas nosocomialis]|uniref:Cytochrome c n=1 Tax=Stutzerimonas nosocomialis TaxID=1056496 RepID=A0A5R9QDF5_9GAMM|nr:cytochrome c [Stutzerimonas nosocomialis]TLX60420.1 cytochrome c [Stutzerimonas nosocomialis]TLX62970.1 cytochrome c [Stutzerimonas nosocomialis]
MAISRPGRWSAGLAGFVLIVANTLCAAATPQDDDSLARGEYLARAGNCLSCHTREGGAPFAGGVPFETPFGTLYSTNITPDRDTGLGQWSDEDFVRALHEGIGRRGEHLYPAFPYTAYTKMSRDDVLAIKQYLDGLEPVAYQPPENRLRFPFNQRATLAAWKLVNFEAGRFQPDPNASDEVNRGAYLSDAVGHCGECHTPRTFTQGLDKQRHYAGATQQGWTAWNITSHARGIGDWSQDKLVRYLSTGHQRGEAVAGGPMAEVVSDSLSWLSDEDIRAIASYLKQLPAREGTVPARSEIEPAGPDPDDPIHGLFVAACESCHYPDDRGAGGPYPSSFPNYSAVRDPAGTNLIRVMLDGLVRGGRANPAFMPAYRDLLTDEQIAELATYIGQRFGGHDTTFSADDVAALRD